MRTMFKSNASGMVRRLSLLAVMMCVGAAVAFAQITGTVTDSQNEPLPGVSVLIKGTQQGVSTDLDGNYAINAKKGQVLVFRYVGMKTQEVAVKDSKVINVQLKDGDAALDEVVVVGYGQQKRGTITGAVSSVAGKDLLNAPTMSISNLVGSRVAGISAKQTSGQPGADNATIYLRGQSGIIYVIDGVKRTSEDFNQLDPNEIDQVSILKDAASIAIYGLDANGVIIVTTKRGRVEKTSISYTGSFGLSQNAETQEWLDGPGYAYWFNRGLEMQGLSPIFTQEHVEKMRQGIDGWGNTNWYKEVFGTGLRTSHNVSAQGGGERVQFFAAASYLKEDGNVDNFGFNRWNIRSNIDANLGNGLKFTLGLSGRHQKQDNPYYSANPDAYGNVGSQMVRMLPYLPKTMTYQGEELYVGNISNGMNASVLASIYNNGYTRYDYNTFNSTMSLQWDTPFLKGLQFKATAAYDAGFNFSKQLNNPAAIMLYKRGAAEFVAPNVLEYMYYRNFNDNYIALTEGASRSATLTTLGTVSYNNNFGLHHVSALALAETRQYNTNNIGAYGRGLNFISLDELSHVSNQRFDGSEFPPSVSGGSSASRVAGFAGRVNYNYDDRYFVEASVRRDGSYLFGGMNKRWVTLPGVSLGWRLDREGFFPSVDWVQNLKVRGGFGKTATSGISPFQWRNTMIMGKNAVVIGGQSTSYISASTLGNPNLTWSSCDNYNIGFDATLWNGLLGMEFDAFYKYEYDKLTSSTGAYPPSMGGYYFSTANLNRSDYRGFDLTLTHQNRIGDFSYGAKLIWSFATGRYLFVASDSPEAPDYQRLTGKQIGIKYGFIANGLYQTEEEIKNAPFPENSTTRSVLLGNIRYIDRNGDGKITYGEDMGYVGRPNMPTHTGSLDLNGTWKGFDFDMLFAWGLGHDVALTGIYTAAGSEGYMDHTSYTLPFKWYGNSPVYLVENSWTPENPNATFPRLCASPQNNNDAYASTFWYRRGDYLRMKSAQIGYTLPASIVKVAGVTRLRVFAEGYNLFTFSGLSRYNIDPESPAVNNGYYPQQRKFSFGLNVTF